MSVMYDVSVDVFISRAIQTDPDRQCFDFPCPYTNLKNEMPVINERTPNCIESYDTEMCVNFHYGAMQVTTRAEDYGTDRTDITNPYMRHSLLYLFREDAC